MQACANAAKIWMQVSLNCFTELIIKKEKLLQLLLFNCFGLITVFLLKVGSDIPVYDISSCFRFRHQREVKLWGRLVMLWGQNYITLVDSFLLKWERYLQKELGKFRYFMTLYKFCERKLVVCNCFNCDICIFYSRSLILVLACIVLIY